MKQKKPQWRPNWMRNSRRMNSTCSRNMTAFLVLMLSVASPIESQAAPPEPKPPLVGGLLLSPVQEDNLSEALKSCEVATQQLTDTQAALVSCRKSKFSPTQFWQTPTYAIAVPLAAVIIGFILAGVVHR